MTAKTPATLITQFQNGDIPTQGDFQDVFDSFANFIQTTAQSIQSPLTIAGNLVVTSALVCAAAINAATVSAATVYANTIFVSSQSIAGNLSVGTGFSSSGTFQRVITSVACAGSAQGQAKLLTDWGARVTNASAGGDPNGVILTSVFSNGLEHKIWNQSGGNLKVYPHTGHQINTLGGNNPYVISTSSEGVTFTRLDTTTWITG